MTTNGTRMMMRTSSHASTRELTMTNAEWLEYFADDWDSEVSKRTSERLMSCAAELRAYESLQATTSLEMQDDQTTRELVKGAIDETRELVRSLPEELFVLRKKVSELEEIAAQLANACEVALHDFDEIVNATMVPALKVHPFNLTPADLRAALAAYRQHKETGNE